MFATAGTVHRRIGGLCIFAFLSARTDCPRGGFLDIFGWGRRCVSVSPPHAHLEFFRMLSSGNLLSIEDKLAPLDVLVRIS